MPYNYLRILKQNYKDLIIPIVGKPSVRKIIKVEQIKVKSKVLLLFYYLIYDSSKILNAFLNESS